MFRNQHLLIAFITAFSTLLLLISGTVSIITAQPSDDRICGDNLRSLFTIAGEACINKTDGNVCSGGSSPIVEPAGPVANSVAQQGALVPVDVIESIHTSEFAHDGTAGGLVWFRAREQGYSALLVGDAAIRDFPIENFPAWQNMIVTTTPVIPACAVAPGNMVIIQNGTRGEIAQFGVNGVSMVLDGTVVVQTEGTRTLFLVVDGILRIIANGQNAVMIAGQQSATTYADDTFTRPQGGPETPMPYEIGRLVNLTVNLLDRSILVPQPGMVSTTALVNLRSGPSTHNGIIARIPDGVVMSVLGKNPDGDWYHVILPMGLTGWMFAELLVQSVGEIEAVYQSTPAVPQRLGRIGHTARVLVDNGANLRTQPYTNYGIIAVAPLGTEVELVARSPYGPWVKVRAGDTEGWVALVALETQAVIQALPYDTTVVPPPEPTTQPGLTGNAFPDPGCWPNC